MTPESIERSAAKRRKPVEKYDLKTGEVLENFPSLRHAQDSVAVGNIGDCVRDYSGSSGGFGWRYKTEKDG